jgi:hypothetical protein
MIVMKLRVAMNGGELSEIRKTVDCVSHVVRMTHFLVGSLVMMVTGQATLIVTGEKMVTVTKIVLIETEMWWVIAYLKDEKMLHQRAR